MGDYFRRLFDLGRELVCLWHANETLTAALLDVIEQATQIPPGTGYIDTLQGQIENQKRTIVEAWAERDDLKARLFLMERARGEDIESARNAYEEADVFRATLASTKKDLEAATKGLEAYIGAHDLRVNERDAAIRERDDARAERDSAIRERDDTRTSNKLLNGSLTDLSRQHEELKKSVNLFASYLDRTSTHLKTAVNRPSLKGTRWASKTADAEVTVVADEAYSKTVVLKWPTGICTRFERDRLYEEFSLLPNVVPETKRGEGST